MENLAIYKGVRISHEVRDVQNASGVRITLLRLPIYDRVQLVHYPTSVE
jgi:hypothetical protein